MTTLAADAAENSLAPAVTRAVRILGLLADNDGPPLGLSDLSRALGAAKSSTSNVCAVLEDSGLISRRGAGFVLGRRTAELGGAYLASFDQVREFYDVCAQSPVLSRELVQIAVLDRTDVLYLARHEGKRALRVTAGIGDRFPASATAVGNALLAELSGEQMAERFPPGVHLPRLTDRSIATRDALDEALEATRARGYALDEGGVFPHVTGLAMTIPARTSGEHTLALGVSIVDMGPTDTPSEARRDEVLAAMSVAVTLLTNPMAPPPPTTTTPTTPTTRN